MKIIVVTLLLLFCIKPAYAYVDPGTGSMLFSIVLSISSILFFVAVSMYEKIKLYFFRDKTAMKSNYPIVIYTEDKRYFHVFNDIIDEFENRQYPLMVFVADNDDPFLQKEYKFVKVENIGKGNKAFSKLAFMSADVCLMTTPGLDVYHLRRSKYVKHYSHIFHCLDEGTAYRLFGLDYYDSVMLNFEGSKQNIRELEQKRNLPSKELVVIGSPFMDSMAKVVPENVNGKKTTVLLAPSWGESAILANYGELLIQKLSLTKFNTIIRPHPQSLVSEKQLIDRLQEKFSDCENIKWDFSNDNLQTMASADVLITDFSSIIYEFLFLFNKPCIYSLSSYNREIYDLSDLENGTYRDSILERIGKELTLDNIENIEELINSLVKNSNSSDEILKIKNEFWQEQNNGAKNVVDFLINKQNELVNKNDNII